jgi:tetratricopeptide (TPR) repeat protein
MMRFLRFGVLVLFCLICRLRVVAQANPSSPQKLFHNGQQALEQGRLKQAEEDFKGVIAVDHNSAAAYANLGVVYMRQRQWNPALGMLEKAQHISPGLPGIRLNIGLVHYRQNQFQEAIPAFESVVRDQPDSLQARYLLGLCYFLTQKYAEAISALGPLEVQESSDLNFLYVLAIAAWKAKQPEVEQRALTGW